MRLIYLVLLLTTCCLLSNPPVQAKDPASPRVLNDLEKRLVGTWIGGGPCVGDAIFEADGTFIFFNYGPSAGMREFGTWQIDNDEVPLRLVIAGRDANTDETAQAESFELVTLNEKQLDYKYPGGRVAEHLRGKTSDDFEIRLGILDSAVQNYLGNARLGDGTKLPDQLQQLVDAKLIPPKALKDCLGCMFEYDRAGKNNNGKRPDIWTKDKDGNVIGNWMFKD